MSTVDTSWGSGQIHNKQWERSCPQREQRVFVPCPFPYFFCRIALPFVTTIFREPE